MRALALSLSRKGKECAFRAEIDQFRGKNYTEASRKVKFLLWRVKRTLFCFTELSVIWWDSAPGLKLVYDREPKIYEIQHDLLPPVDLDSEIANIDPL